MIDVLAFGFFSKLPIQPRDINVSDEFPFTGAFGQAEMEQAAASIIRYLQERGCSWAPICLADARRNRHFLNIDQDGARDLIDGGFLVEIKELRGHLCLTVEFIVRCHIPDDRDASVNQLAGELEAFFLAHECGVCGSKRGEPCSKFPLYCGGRVANGHDSDSCPDCARLDAAEDHANG